MAFASSNNALRSHYINPARKSCPCCKSHSQRLLCHGAGWVCMAARVGGDCNGACHGAHPPPIVTITIIFYTLIILIISSFSLLLSSWWSSSRLLQRMSRCSTIGSITTIFFFMFFIIIAIVTITIVIISDIKIILTDHIPVLILQP